MATAAQKVMALPELLENILQHLSTKQLFVIQRVNTTFKVTVCGSRQLRRTMFLDPVAIDNDSTTDDDAIHELSSMLNPLLRKNTVTSMSSYQLSVFKASYGTPRMIWNDEDFEIVYDREYKVDCSARTTEKLNAADGKASWRSMVLAKNGWDVNFSLFTHGYTFADSVNFTVVGTTELGKVADVVGEIHRRFNLWKLDAATDKKTTSTTLPTHSEFIGDASLPSSATMPSAAERVFGVPELMEMILLECDFDYKQLFAVERASRDFQAALQISKKIRRVMSLEPDVVMPTEFDYIKSSLRKMSRRWSHLSLPTRRVEKQVFAASESRIGISFRIHRQDAEERATGSWRAMRLRDDTVPVDFPCQFRPVDEHFLLDE